MSERIEGPLIAGRNWAADAGTGSIHDDETAAELGFRGGTVPGDVHINQLVPVLLDAFGAEWHHSGHLSLMFRNATIDREPVRAIVEPVVDPSSQGNQQTNVRIERDDGLLICEGSAGVGSYANSALRSRDLRPCSPDGLKILRNVQPGMSLGSYDIEAVPDRQFERFDAGLIGDALPAYREPDESRQVIACPSTVVQYLWGVPMDGLRPHVPEAVGLFGAIEIAFDNGPWRLPARYRLDSHVVCLSESPKTESLWFETRAFDGDLPIVTFRMLLRFMKASVD